MTTPYIRPDVSSIEEQQILAVAKLALGDDSVIPLWYGESDIVTDSHIRRAAVDALEAGQTFYSHKTGTPALRRAIADYTAGLYGIDIGTERITVTASGMAAIQMVFQATLEQDDNAIVVAPVWPNAQSTVRVMGAEPRFCTLDNDPDSGWSLDLDKLKSMVDERTRLVFVNAPNNPSGWVMPRGQQAELLAFARDNGLWIVADEVYARMVYDGNAAPSFLEIAEPGDPLFVINSFSKSWAMTGWRIGWVVHPETLPGSDLSFTDLFGNMIEFSYSCVPPFLQAGAVAAIRDGEPMVAAMIEHCRRGRDIVCQRLPAIARIEAFRPPEASFYAFFRIAGTEGRTLRFAQDLVRAAKVGVAPGTAFGPTGEGWFRICFAQSPDRLAEAMNRLEHGLSVLD